MILADAPQPSWAGVITAVAGVITAAALLAAALPALIVVMRRAKTTEAKIDAVHVIVNQQKTDMGNYQRALIEALRTAGVDVPADQSLPPLSRPAESGG